MQQHDISWSPFHISTSRKATFFPPSGYITFNCIAKSYFNIYHLPMNGHLGCSDFFVLQTILQIGTFLNIYCSFYEMHRNKNTQLECVNILNFNR